MGIFIPMIKLKSLLAEALTPVQNDGLKKLYVLVRDIVLDVLQKMQAAGLNAESTRSQLVPFLLHVYKSPFPTVKQGSMGALRITLPPEYLQVFPNLRSEFDIDFRSNAELEDDSFDAALSRSRMDKKINGIKIRMGALFADTNTLKSQIQHELQHIVDYSESDIDTGKENKALMWLEYLEDNGEISSYAKQCAYLHFKKFPTDSQFDMEKFKKNALPNNLSPVTMYIRFGENADALAAKWKLDASVVKRMTDTYQKFVGAINSYYKFFVTSLILRRKLS